MRGRRAGFCALLALALVASGASGEGEAKPPHPEPRVIVSVERVTGPHARGEVERAARLGWGRIVRCYKASPERPRGDVTMDVDLASNGKVTATRRKRSTLDRELTRCLLGTMRQVKMPGARARSTARIEIRVAPGDP